MRQPGFRHRYLPIAESGASLPLAERATSLDRARILDLGAETPCDVELDAGEAIVGLVCDLANSSGYLRLSGESDFTACLKTDYYRGDRSGLVTSIVPIVRPVAARDGRVTLGVSATGEAQLAFVGKDFVSPSPDAGVIGLVLRRPVPDLALQPPRGRPFNLLREASPATLDRLKADLHAIRQGQAQAA